PAGGAAAGPHPGGVRGRPGHPHHAAHPDVSRAVQGAHQRASRPGRSSEMRERMPYPGARSVSTISHGPRPPVLVVDFAQFDTTTTLAELLAATRDRTVYRIDAVSDLGRPIAPVSIPEMAADYAGQVAALAPVPAVVVAYCSAAVLGMHIVGNLVANGHPEPRMILVEPTWLTTQILGQV